MRKLIYAEATNFARAKAAEECKSSSDDGGGATADNDDGRLELDGEALDQSKKGAGANKRRNRSASLQEIPRARELTTTTANYGRAAVANDGGSHSGSAQRSGAPRLSHDGVEALAGRIRPGRYIRASHDGQIRTSDGGDEGGGVRKVTVGGVTFAPPGGDPSASATLSAGNSRSRIGLTPDRELGDGEQMGSGGNSNSQRGGRRHDRHSFDQPAVLERRMDQAAQQQAQRSRARNSDPLSEHVRAEAETVRSAGELMHGGNSNTAPDSSHIDADANANGNAHGNSSGNVNDGATHKETLGGELPTKLPQLSPSTTAATAGVSIGSIGSGSAVVRTSGLGSISSAELAQLDARGAKPSQAGGSFPASGTSALQPKTVPPIKLPPKRVAPGPDKHVPSDPEREAGGSEDEEEEETLDDECSAFGKTKSPHRERV